MVTNKPIALFGLAAFFFLNQTISYYWGLLMQYLDPQGEFPSLLLSQWQIVAGMICLIAALFFWWRDRRRVNQSKSDVSQEHLSSESGTAPAQIENFYSKVFESEIVQIDNRHFHDCRFRNVMFRWDGGFYIFSNVSFEGQNGFSSYNRTIVDTMSLLKFLGCLEPTFAQGLRDLPPEAKNGKN